MKAFVKISACFALLAMAFAFVACGNPNSTKTNSGGTGGSPRVPLVDIFAGTTWNGDDGSSIEFLASGGQVRITNYGVAGYSQTAANTVYILLGANGVWPFVIDDNNPNSATYRDVVYTKQ